MSLRVDAHQWPAISALLDEALALAPGERDTFVRQLDGERAKYRDTLLQLLAQATGVETDEFLATLPRLSVARLAADDALAEPAAGATVGPYRLLSELGAGGMGTVWLAERADGTLKRKVALKLPRLAWGRGLAERMARERDILASLEHPHIARLYDAGVDQHGRPYLALEYVEGQPIDAYAQERGLSVRARLDLLLQVCGAVAFAHSRLVVHRDLKPSNILVTADGQVRLLDFGIAKLMEGDRTQETQLTQMSGRALTLDYASPEQIKGEPIGTASDVYSLGVVSYELLTGEKPYKLKRGSAAELEEAIASAEPPRASDATTDVAAKKALKNDLDAILNKVLKKAPGSRYPSADALAQDIERHLHGQPVQALPDRPMYRLGKFVLRNRWPLAAASTVLLTIAVGAGVSITQAVSAKAQAKRAGAAVDQQSAVRELYVEAMNTLAARAADNAGDLSKPHAVSKILKSTLEEMAPRYDDRANEMEAMLQAVMLQLSFTSNYEDGLQVAAKYIAHMKAHGADADRIIDAHAAMGRLYYGLGRYEDSEAINRAGLAWAPDARDWRTRRSRMGMASELGDDLITQGKRAEAEQLLLGVEATASRDFADDRERFDNLHRLGRLYAAFDDAKALRYAAQAHAGLVSSKTPNRDALGDSLGKLGARLLAVGRAAEAELVLREAHQIYVEFLGRADRLTVRALGAWASSLAAQGKHAEARELLQHERRLLHEINNDSAKAATVTLRARALENEWLYGDGEAAVALVGRTPDDIRKGPGVLDPSVFLSLEGRALILAGRAEEAYQRTALVQRAIPPNRQFLPGGVFINLTLGEAQIASGRHAAARETLSRLVENMQALGATATWNYVVAVELAAWAAAMNAGAEQALKEIAAADAQLRDIASPSSVEQAESALRRARIYRAANRSREAQALAGTARKLLSIQHPRSPRLAEANLIATP